MASRARAVAENIPGDFFVDSTCINCDTCRQLAPETFDEVADHSFVCMQPSGETDTRAATRAMLACPTGSIGTLGRNKSREVIGDFPLPIDGPVSYCGFTSKDSFGGSSYFIRHPRGNWLVDAPRFVPHLVKKFEEAGGVRHIFLTHRDDVADAGKYARQFGAERIIHHDDLSAQPDAERVLEGTADVDLAPGFVAIPVPGHSEGHVALLVDGKYLFSGDHLWWSRERNGLGASPGVAWYSWAEQKRSLKKLLDYSFEWVLPGHGDRMQLPACSMRRQLEDFLKTI